MIQALNVCWVAPDDETIEGACLLSFLRPSIEERYVRKYNDNVISGRLVAQEVKEEALKAYVAIVAKIASDKSYKGKSLRERLRIGSGCSLWWYHPVSYKACETDSTFNRLIQIMAIDKTLKEKESGKVILWGADDVIVDVLATKYQVVCRRPAKQHKYLEGIRAVGSRLSQLIINFYHWYMIRRNTSDIAYSSDVVLEGFWDWSVQSNKEQRGKPIDRYFKSLPSTLNNKGMRTSWFVWFSPHSDINPKRRTSRSLLRNARYCEDVVFLQRYLSPRDIVKVFCDFRPLFTYLSVAKSVFFRDLFSNNGFNLFYLFKDSLLYYFMSSPIPQHVLIEKAWSNALELHKPEFVLTFLEMFPYSRALYAGAKKGNAKPILAAMQHASYSREKTFARYDPEIEFCGKPDGCAIPAPDYLFAMGHLGKEIFQECGFKPEKVYLTGSARYDYIGKETNRMMMGEKKTSYNVLMVASLDRDIEIDMIEAACCAAEGLPDIQLLLRNHPFLRTDNHPFYKPLKERIRITTGTLDEDLDNADLVLFSYSTVAEEAFIKGIPVWQWCSATFNGSVFRDIEVVPRFSTIEDLREGFMKFRNEPGLFAPDHDTCNDVLKRCFYKGDGKASERIADTMIQLSVLHSV